MTTVADKANLSDLLVTSRRELRAEGFLFGAEHTEPQASLSRAYHYQFLKLICHTHMGAIISYLIMMCKTRN